jgi:hypothetical protein
MPKDYVKFSTPEDELFISLGFTVFLREANSSDLSDAHDTSAAWHVGTIAKRARFP